MTDSASPGRPDPASARTPVEFVAAMRRLKRWSGLGYRRLETRAYAAGDALPRSTITAALTRDTLPREALVAAFARTCGCDKNEVERWVAAWRRVAAARPARAPATAFAVVPAQLPLDVPGFAGRERELAVLDSLLGTAGRPPTTVVISALSGTAGVGKTDAGL